MAFDTATRLRLAKNIDSITGTNGGSAIVDAIARAVVEGSTEIDADIATHAGLPTVHQDAPNLILTHKGDAGAHHTKYTDAAAKAQAEGAKLDDHAVPDDNTDLDASSAKHGLMPKTDKIKIDTVATNADVTGSNPPQAHTLDSHSTKAHSELSDAPEDAHHTKFTATEHSSIGDGAPHHTKYTDAAALAATLDDVTSDPLIDGDAAADGTEESLARKDHVHPKHHAKYLDSAAKAAAVQAGAITNAVTKAPTHDAVFDVKATADGAIPKTLLTTRGDIIYRNATVPARLAKGSDGDVLTMGADEAAWAAPAGGLTESQLHTELIEDIIVTTVLATVADFQTNPATGTMAGADNINDNNTSANANSDTVGKYAEVDFGKPVIIKRWRQFGHTTNVGDGVWKIQYYDLASDSWEDWVTGIATRTTADWSSLVTETARLTTKVKLITTTLDTAGSDISRIGELEVIY